jgi:hypothetical protein
LGLEVLVSKSRIDCTSQIWGIHISVHFRIRGTITDAETIADSLDGLLNLKGVVLVTCTSCSCIGVDHISLLQLEDELLGSRAGMLWKEIRESVLK